MRIRTLFVVLFFQIAYISAVSSQNIAVKSNLLYDATGTINIATEWNFSKKWSLDMSVNYNDWASYKNKTLHFKHLLIQPELRYWFCETFNGHFLAFHLIGAKYNVGGFKNRVHFWNHNFSELEKHRYEGWMMGAGIGYGYSWILSHHWNFEAEIGIGYLYSPQSDKYKCEECGELLETNDRALFGITKLALNFIYLF